MVDGEKRALRPTGSHLLLPNTSLVFNRNSALVVCVTHPLQTDHQPVRHTNTRKWAIKQDNPFGIIQKTIVIETLYEYTFPYEAIIDRKRFSIDIEWFISSR